MTVVNLAFTFPNGYPVPGPVRYEPTAQRDLEGSVELPGPGHVPLVDGEAAINISPTEAGVWAWKFTVRAGSQTFTYYKEVPASGPVDFDDLVDIDPTSLNATTLLPAWRSYIDTAVADLVAGAPGALDTLNELSAALGDDPDLAAQVALELGNKATTAALSAHTSNTANPHAVTKAQVGLPNVRDDADPLRFDATKLRAWKAALGARATTPVDILVVGDSLVEGQGATASTKRWIDLVRDGVRTRFQPAGITGGEGYVPGFYVAAGVADRWATTGTVALREDLGGLGERTLVLAAGATGVLTFTGTGVDLLYEKGPVAGTYSWKIDAGSATSVGASSGTLSGGNVTQIRGLSAASHTLTVTAVSSNTYVEGGMVYNGDESAGIRMWAAGHSGWQSDDLANSGSVNWFESVTPVQPDLVIIHLGLNDYGSQSQARVSPTAMKANIATLLTNIRARCTVPPSVVLAIPYERFLPVGTLLGTWTEYRTAITEAAEADGNVTLLDLGKTVGSLNPTDPYDFDDADGVHPNDRGHRAIADAFVSLLTNL